MILEMGAAALAEKVVPMLLPLLPHLLKGATAAGEKFAQAIGEKSVNVAVDVAEKIWGKIKPKIEQVPAAQKLVQDAAEDPRRGYLPGALAYQLKELFDDEKFRKEIVEIISKGEEKGANLESFIEAGKIYGEVTGIEVLNLDALEQAGLISSKIKTRFVGKGSKVTGIKIGK